MIGFTTSEHSRPRADKLSPRAMRGFCIVRLFDEQRDVRLSGFSYRLDPSQDRRQGTMLFFSCK